LAFLKELVCLAQISGTSGRPPPTILRIAKLDEWTSYMVEFLLKFLSFCHNSRVWQTDRQTNG